jgi:hypothetical protein
MSVHAFIDESGRNGVYIVCVTVVAPADLAPVRKELSALLLPGQRELHFKKEKPRRRRLLVAWCYGAGGDWRRRVQPGIAAVIKL